MNMNREVLEEEARKIQELAKSAQAGLQTMNNLQKCFVEGHNFQLRLEQQEFHEILQMRLVCHVCGAETELFENIALAIPEDAERFGALESLGLDEIDIDDGDGATIDFDSVEETVSTDIKESGTTEESMENGVTKVDVSGFIKELKEQRGIENENSGDKK